MIHFSCEGGPLDGLLGEAKCPAPVGFGKRTRAGTLVTMDPKVIDSTWTRYELDADLVYRPAADSAKGQP